MALRSSCLPIPYLSREKMISKYLNWKKKTLDCTIVLTVRSLFQRMQIWTIMLSLFIMSASISANFVNTEAIEDQMLGDTLWQFIQKIKVLKFLIRKISNYDSYWFCIIENFCIMSDSGAGECLITRSTTSRLLFDNANGYDWTKSLCMQLNLLI